MTLPRYQRTSLHIQHLQVYPVWQLEMIEKKEYKGNNHKHLLINQ